MQQKKPLDEVDIDVVAENSSWVVINPGTDTSPLPNTHFIVWLSDKAAEPALLTAARKLAESRNVFPGAQLKFHEEPEPGFVLTTKKGWHLDTPEATQRMLDNIVWELNRLTRG